MYDIFVRNITVLPMTAEGPVLENHDVVIEGQNIVALSETGALKPEAKRVIEGAGYVLLPGFVNTHTHMGQTFFRATCEALYDVQWLKVNVPIVDRLTPEDVYWASCLAACEMLHAGVTTFADMFRYEDQVAQASLDTGIRAQVAQGIMQKLFEAKMDRGPGEELISSALDVAARWHGAADGRITARLAPHALYSLMPATLRDTLAEAKRHGYGLHMHLAESLAEVEYCREKFGTSPVRHAQELGYLEVPLLAAHCIYLSDEDMEILDRSGIGIAHNPGANLKGGKDKARIPELMAHKKLAIGLGTDSTGGNDSLDVLKETYLAAVIHPWPTDSKPSRICLEMATREGARALGLDDQIGTIEVGKRADLVLLDLESARMSPQHDLECLIVYAGRACDVKIVIVDGVIVLEDGELTTIDEGRVLRESRQRAARVFAA